MQDEIRCQIETSYTKNLRSIKNLNCEKLNIKIDLKNASFWERSKKQKLQSLLNEIDITQDKVMTMNNQLTDHLINLDFHFLY